MFLRDVKPTYGKAIPKPAPAGDLYADHAHRPKRYAGGPLLATHRGHMQEHVEERVILEIELLPQEPDPLAWVPITRVVANFRLKRLEDIPDLENRKMPEIRSNRPSPIGDKKCSWVPPKPRIK